MREPDDNGCMEGKKPAQEVITAPGAAFRLDFGQNHCSSQILSFLNYKVQGGNICPATSQDSVEPLNEN